MKAAFEDEPDLADLWNKFCYMEARNPFPSPRQPRSLDESIDEFGAPPVSGG